MGRSGIMQILSLGFWRHHVFLFTSLEVSTFHHVRRAYMLAAAPSAQCLTPTQREAQGAEPSQLTYRPVSMRKKMHTAIHIESWGCLLHSNS